LVGDEAEAWRRPSASVKKTALAVTMASRPWRLRFREVVREVEEGVAVRFPSSAGRAAVHGDGGGRRQWRFFSRYLTERCKKWRKKKGRRGAGEEGSELGFCQHLVYMEGKRGKWQAS
jgi:hypothetical protein